MFAGVYRSGDQLINHVSPAVHEGAATIGSARLSADSPRATSMPLSLAVLDVVAQVLGTREVIDDPDLPLYEHDLLDSLRTVELIVALSDRFHIQISPAAIDRDAWATPRRIAAFVESQSAVRERAR